MMTPQEQKIIDRHKQLAKSGWRDPGFLDYKHDGYVPIGITLQMCICDLCLKASAEKYPFYLKEKNA